MIAIVTPTPIPIKCISFDDELGEVDEICDEVGDVGELSVTVVKPNVVVHEYQIDKFH